MGAGAAVGLPEGFTLDAPAGQATLPAGFKLDAPSAPVEETWAQKALKAGLPWAKSAILGGGPVGIATHGVGEAMKGIDKAAYDVGGWATDVTGSPKAGLVANAVAQAPGVLIGGGIGKAATPAMEGSANWLMRSALKNPYFSNASSAYCEHDG